jgi:hypothetical protein
VALPAASATTRETRETSSWRLGPASPWAWALGSAAWYVANAYVTLPVVAAFPAAQFLLQPLIWGGAVLGGVLVLARFVFRRSLPMTWPSLALAIAGLVLAGLLEASLHDWALTRLGVFEWRLIGPTAGLFAVIVGSAVAGFGVLVAPRGGTLAPLVMAVGGALVSGLVVAMNMPGLGDGMEPGSVVPALLIAAGGAYALIVAFISVVMAVRRELLGDPTSR